MGLITEDKYNILDYVMCDAATLGQIRDLRTHREAALATDHYLLTVDFQHSQHDDPLPHKPPRDRDLLRDPAVQSLYAEAFLDEIAGHTVAGNVDAVWEQGARAAQVAAAVLPRRPEEVKRPWVSQRTLALIQQRSEARASNDRPEERRLLKEVRRSCKNDKTMWLDSNIASGRWDDIRRFCRPRQHKQGRLQNIHGQLVESHERADTMATYLVCFHSERLRTFRRILSHRHLAHSCPSTAVHYEYYSPLSRDNVHPSKLPPPPRGRHRRHIRCGCPSADRCRWRGRGSFPCQCLSCGR